MCKNIHTDVLRFSLCDIRPVLRSCSAVNACHLPSIYLSVPLCIQYTENYWLDKYSRDGSYLCRNRILRSNLAHAIYASKRKQIAIMVRPNHRYGKVGLIHKRSVRIPCHKYQRIKTDLQACQKCKPPSNGLPCMFSSQTNRKPLKCWVFFRCNALATENLPPFDSQFQ